MSEPSSPREYTREEMREACEQNYRAGVLAERERCARIVEEIEEMARIRRSLEWATALRRIAAAIRESEERTTDE